MNFGSQLEDVLSQQQAAMVEWLQLAPRKLRNTLEVKFHKSRHDIIMIQKKNLLRQCKSVCNLHVFVKIVRIMITNIVYGIMFHLCICRRVMYAVSPCCKWGLALPINSGPPKLLVWSSKTRHCWWNPDWEFQDPYTWIIWRYVCTIFFKPYCLGNLPFRPEKIYIYIYNRPYIRMGVFVFSEMAIECLLKPIFVEYESHVGVEAKN